MSSRRRASTKGARPGRQEGTNARGVLLGCSSGVVFGMLAGVLKLTVNTEVEDGPNALITTRPLWVMLELARSGVVLNQHAYQRSPPTVTMPCSTWSTCWWPSVSATRH